FVWAGEVGLALVVGERVCARARLDRHVADQTVGWTARTCELFIAGPRRRRRDVRIGAVADAGEFGRHSGRKRDVDLAELLLPVAPCEVQLERAVGPRFR